MNKERKAYRKMHSQHRKELIEIAKEDREWDYDYLHDIVMTKIRHMYEYYVAGNNVWQTEESKEPIVAELKHVLDLDAELHTMWDGYINCEREYCNASISEKPDVIDKVNDFRKREEELYKEIYEYIGQHMLGWWD